MTIATRARVKYSEKNRMKSSRLFRMSCRTDDIRVLFVPFLFLDGVESSVFICCFCLEEFLM